MHPDASAGPRLDRRQMHEEPAAPASYAVRWQEPDGEVMLGELVLERQHAILRGSGADGSVARRRLPYAEVTRVRVGRSPEERLAGGRTVILERGPAAALRIAPLGPGLLSELAEMLAQLSGEVSGDVEWVVVVVPLKPARRARAAALLAQGAPFDPEEAGFESHDVFLTEREVIFLFRGRQVTEAVRRLAGAPELWRAALDWRACIDGEPRLAEPRYEWAQTRPG
jgi:hypothetical protein